MASSETQSPRRTRLRGKQNIETDPNDVVTPTKNTVAASAITPRRSARKSCKPIFDYYEIINVGSPSKKKNTEEDHWNPAVVGRTSEKRGRKRTHGTKPRKEDSSTDDENDLANISLSIFSPNKKTEQLLDKEMTKEIDTQKLNEEEEEAESNQDQIVNEKMETINEEIAENPQITENNNNNKEVSTVESINEEIAENVQLTENNNNNKVSTIETISEDIAENPQITENNNNNKEVSTVEIINEKIAENVQIIENNNNNKVSIVDKSELDFLELGLAPLKDDTDTEHENVKENTADEEMDSLILCDEDEMSAEPHALNATFDTSDCILISPTESLESDRNTLTVPQIVVTSPRSTQKSIEEKKQPRIQTPYKPKQQQEDMEEISHEENVAVVLDRTFDEIIPQGIRKRSASVCTDIRALPRAKRNTNRVTFYSPANQTNYINDSEEEEMAEDNMKENIEKVEEPSFITKRRRRSMSLDETIMRKPAIKKPLTPMKPTGSRIKLPNFAAIHKKNFEQMENIVEHVARKAERAKVLTSATKKPLGSTGKTQTPGRFGRLSTFEKEKTKAVRKIDLGIHSRIPIIIPTPATTMTPQTRFKKAASAEPQSFKNLHKIKSQAISKKPLAKITMSKSAVDITVAAMKAMENTSTFTFKSMLQRGGEASSSAVDKLAERRKRNMDMFKNRQAEDEHMRVQRKRDEIRGVRLNRRHLLQMEHRRNMSKLN